MKNLSVFNKIKTLEKKENADKERRERLKLMNNIRKDEREKVIADIRTQIQAKMRFIAVDEKTVCPFIDIITLTSILDEQLRVQRKKRKFN